MPIYEKSTKLLFQDLIKDLGIQKGQIIERSRIYSWFKQKYPLLKKGTISAHIILYSTNAQSRIHHTVDPNGKNDLFYQIDSTRLRLYDSSTDPTPIYNNTSEDVITESESPENINEQNEFAYEKDLQNFLAKNLYIIESGLSLYMDEGINGLEFPVGSRAIDILAIDKDKNFVVIELKVSRGYDRVVGQLLRYIAWIRQNHAEENQKVRGIIIAREITEDLLLACSETNNIDLFEYRLSVSLRKIDKKK
jgi:endonuclease